MSMTSPQARTTCPSPFRRHNCTARQAPPASQGSGGGAGAPREALREGRAGLAARGGSPGRGARGGRVGTGNPGPAPRRRHPPPRAPPLPAAAPRAAWASCRFQGDATELQCSGYCFHGGANLANPKLHLTVCPCPTPSVHPRSLQFIRVWTAGASRGQQGRGQCCRKPPPCKTRDRAHLGTLGTPQTAAVTAK